MKVNPKNAPFVWRHQMLVHQ